MPPTGVVTGASGDSAPLPMLETSVPALDTVAPVFSTTPPRLAAVVLTGFALVPMVPSPAETPSPSVDTAPPRFDTTSPAAFVVPAPTPGAAVEPIAVPTPDTAPPAADTTLPVLSATAATG